VLQGLVAGSCSLALLLACAAPPAAAPAAPAQPSGSTAGAPAAAAPTAAPVAAAAPEPAVVRVGILNSIGDAAFTIGLEKGYYAEQGITIETVPFDSAARMIAPLSQGQIETGQGVIGAGAMNAVARGVEIRGIAGASGSPPGHGNSSFIVRKDLWDSGALRNPADLRGRRVALTAKGTGIEVLWAKLLERGGLTPDDVEMTQLNFGEQVTALGNGAVDVATPSEPAATVALDRGFGML
jgi:NitT/TauT family transport system substrate-binding protein